MYIGPEVTVNKGAETIQVRKLFKGGNYMGKYGIFLKHKTIETHACAQGGEYQKRFRQSVSA